MKSLLKQLSETTTPASALEIIQAHNDTKAKTDLKALASTLVDEHYTGSDDGRRHELKNALSQALQTLSKKLASGAKVSLRLAAPKRPKTVEGESPSKADQATIKQIEELDRIQVAVNESKTLVDYQAHTSDLTRALQAPPEVESKPSAAER